MTPVRQVFRYAFGTAVATGLGAIPFAFIRTIDKKVMWWANALAAWLMMWATYGLLDTGFKENWQLTMFGVVIGAGVILVIKYWLDTIQKKKKINLQATNAILWLSSLSRSSSFSAILIIIVMTIHSATEGLGVGASFGGSLAFGITIAIAIAVHNIPEGIAISASLVAKGEKRWKAGLRSIFTSLPQPLFAVPAFLFIVQFKPYIPLWLWFAWGAMLWLSFADIIPEAQENLPTDLSATIITLALMSMIAFQFSLGAW